jgi:hypothetical protein
MSKYVIFNTVADVPKQASLFPNQNRVVTHKGMQYTYVGSLPKSGSRRVSEFFALIGKIASILAIYPLFHTQAFSASLRKCHQKLKEKNLKVLCKELPPVPGKKDASLARNPAALLNAILDCKKRYAVCVKQHPHLQNYPLLGRLNWIPGEFGMWMGGCALVGTYLAKKHGLKDMYVCETLESLTQKIDQIALSFQDQRAAFVVPAFSATRQSHGAFFSPNFPQHKVTVCVEKQGSELKIALLEAQPLAGNDFIRAAHVEGKTIWSGIDQIGSFNTQELVFRAILKASLPQSTQLFYSGVKREIPYGCAVFALRDAVAFLKSPDFFRRINCDSAVELSHCRKIQRISHLTPAFMVGTQSYSSLSAYVQQYPNEAQEKLPGKNKTLTDAMKANRILDRQGRAQNHYITWKMVKYLKLAVDLIEKFDCASLDAEVQATLVS